MIKIIENADSLRLFFNERTVFLHTQKLPFAKSLDLKLKYKSSRGNFKIKENIEGEFALSGYKIVSCADTHAKILFIGFDNTALTVDACEERGNLKLYFSSNRDCGFKFQFMSAVSEAFFGGGEQYRQLNMKGEIIENFVSEHIVVPPIVQKTLLSFIPYKEKPHSYISSYAPMSTYVSSEKYAIRFDTASYGVADFSAKTVAAYYFAKCPASMLYAEADTFAELGKKLNADIENKEYLPDWAYDGMILGVQGGIDRASEKALKLIDDGAKICGIWCQDWSGKKVTAVGSQVYWNWEVDNERYGNLAARIAELKEKGIHFLAYINPYLVENGNLYNYCKEKGYLITRKTGEVYHIKSTTFNAGMMDLTNPNMVAFLKDTIIKKNMLDLGIDGYMADFGEYLPVDCVLHDGNAELLHNEWPVLWAKINREAVEESGREKEIFFFTRSAYNSAQSYTTIMWNGDQHTDFTKDYGMPSTMPATFNLGFSGMTAVHSDVGGFISFNKLVRDDELLIRWIEMNAFTPLMRGHETIRPQANSQYDKPEITPYTAKFSSIHAKIKPYIQSVMSEAKDGVMAMRPDFFNANDFNLSKDLYSFFLGDELFIAPVIERGAVTRKVHLPEGNWIHLFTKEKYSMGAYNVIAPFGEPPVFYREDGKFAKLFESI